MSAKEGNRQPWTRPSAWRPWSLLQHHQRQRQEGLESTTCWLSTKAKTDSGGVSYWTDWQRISPTSKPVQWHLLKSMEAIVSPLVPPETGGPWIYYLLTFNSSKNRFRESVILDWLTRISVTSKPVQGFELQQKQKLDATYQGSVSQTKLCSDVH